MDKFEKLSNKKKEQLGMPSGTATARLRKSILFQLVKETGRNICHQCGKVIETEEELSIEHKVPWLDSKDPVGLFFDLKNIAFSHLRCNIGACRHTKSSETQRVRAKNGLHPKCPLTLKQANEIRALSSKLSGVELAKKYGVSKHTIYRILSGKSFNYD